MKKTYIQLPLTSVRSFYMFQLTQFIKSTSSVNYIHCVSFCKVVHFFSSNSTQQCCVVRFTINLLLVLV